MDSNLNNWYSQSNLSLLETLGHFIRNKRIEQNKTQDEIALESGLNRSTIIQLEKGKGGTLLTFIQVLRALNTLEELKNFETGTQISPLLIARMQKNQRQRVRKQKTEVRKSSDW